jgi:hypothetical protein
MSVTDLVTFVGYLKMHIGVNQISLKAKKKPNWKEGLVAITMTTINAMLVEILLTNKSLRNKQEHHNPNRQHLQDQQVHHQFLQGT